VCGEGLPSAFSHAGIRVNGAQAHSPKALGAELLLTPAALGTDGAIEEVYRLARENPETYFLVDQFNNPHNPASHKGTAREIWEQTEGRVTHVVASIGTTGTLMGLTRYLKNIIPLSGWWGWSPGWGTPSRA
jgi:cysteine synthase